MATDKRFAVAGTSTHQGETKLRFANDILRTKILKKNGHTDINLVELPNEMTKAEAIQYLQSIDFGKGSVDVQTALSEGSKKNPTKTAPKSGKTKTAKVKVTETSVTEDAPF